MGSTFFPEDNFRFQPLAASAASVTSISIQPNLHSNNREFELAQMRV